MSDFIDISGVSGASYRFRVARHPSALPTAAGNFVFVRGDDAGPQILCCGSTSSLAQAAALWPAAVEAHQVDAIYIHLNISRSHRMQVHEDIADKHRPPMVVAHLDN